MKKRIFLILLVIMLADTSVSALNVINENEKDSNNFSDKEIEVCPIFPSPPVSLNLKGEAYEGKSRSKINIPIIKILNLQIGGFFKIFLNTIKLFPTQNTNNKLFFNNNVLSLQQDALHISDTFKSSLSNGNLELTGDGDFGRVKVCSKSEEYSKTRDFTLKNTGDDTVRGYIYLEEEEGFHGFYITQGGGDFTLKTEESMIIKVLFWPTIERKYSATLNADYEGHRNGANVDLEIINLEAYKNNGPGELGYSIRWKIKNVGDGNAYVGNFDLFPDGGMVKRDGVNILLGDFSGYADIAFCTRYPNDWDNILSPGESIDGSDISKYACRPGTLYTLKVDPFDYVPETNENNNGKTIQIPIG